jgi:hypothetical protein
MLFKRTLGLSTLAVSQRIALLITHHILSAANPHIFITFYKWEWEVEVKILSFLTSAL